MRRELMEELEADTTLEDIAEPYRLVVEMIGLKNVLKLSRYFMGDKIYLPKAERILAPARNRRIRREYNGRNAKELAKARGCKALVLDSGMPRKQAHRFYEIYGFEKSCYGFDYYLD